MDKEKNMTQKERADSLFVSAKHISKWGCGKVCPDISLLHQLTPIV
jgi:predicted transcriptional regulator